MKHAKKKQFGWGQAWIWLLAVGVVLVVAGIVLAGLKKSPSKEPQGQAENTGESVSQSEVSMDETQESDPETEDAFAEEENEAEDRDPETEVSIETETDTPEESDPVAEESSENENDTEVSEESEQELAESSVNETDPDVQEESKSETSSKVEANVNTPTQSRPETEVSSKDETSGNQPEESRPENELSSESETGVESSEESASEKLPDGDILELIDEHIKTPYGELFYPEGLSDHLIVANTGENPYTLVYYADMENEEAVPLFEISFGKKEEGYVGDAETLLGKKPMNVVVHPLSDSLNFSKHEFITAQAMQETVNDILEQMAPKDNGQQSETAPETSKPSSEESTENIEIKTPYAPLYFPAQWSETVKYVSDDSDETVYKIHFYGDIDGQKEQLLFSIYFGGDDGEQLGAVKGPKNIPVPVNLLIPELQTDGWDEEDTEQLYAMQEACNVLIEKLPLLP